MRHGLGFHNRHSPGGVFSPLSLFTGGVNGAWYDPSDSTTLFDDRAGTTPCATPGAGTGPIPVGLMLDKSQNLTLGSELVTNGGPFVNTTGWTAFRSTLSAVNGALRITEDGSFADGYARQSFAVTSGSWYRLQVNVKTISNAQGRVQIWVGSAYSAADWLLLSNVTATGTLTAYFRATTNTAFLELINMSSAGGTSEFSEFSFVGVQPLAGNHAIAANDTTARPELSARVNLLTRTEEFDNAAWNSLAAGAVVTPNTNIAPDGTLTADTIAFTSGGYRYQQTTSSAIPAGQSVIYSAWVWSASKAKIVLRVYDASATDIAFQSVSLTATPQRVSITLTATASRTQWFAGFDNRVVAGGDGIAGDVIVWGADLRPANIGTTIPAYQRVADQYTYDNVGFPRYLAFNGTSSAMSTPANVNLSGTDKATVFAGVRKLLDDTDRTLVELSATVNTNNGSFGLFAPSAISGGVANKYVGSLRGTAQSISQFTSYPAPITNVISAQYDIAGATIAAESVYRINAATPTETTNGVTAGTGNFGSYPLFIGARNNASLLLTGSIYSLIVTGSAVSAGNITATEQWVAGKTGITI